MDDQDKSLKFPDLSKFTSDLLNRLDLVLRLIGGPVP
jgi:hypothetical protein